MHARIATRWIYALTAASLVLAHVDARAFSEVVAFGDSLSDDGNVYRLTQGFPNNPQLPFPPASEYFQGRQSNGPVAVEYLAQRLGVRLRNFAQVGATTGIGNIWDTGALGEPAGTLGLSGMQAQVQSYVARPGPANSTALYVLWGGPNDFVAGLSDPLNFNPVAAIQTAVANLSNQALQLYGEGARHFLIPGMPDLGIAPRARELGLANLASDVTSAFNGALDDALGGLRTNLADASIYGIDSFELSHQLQALFAEGDLSAPQVAQPCLAIPACRNDPTQWETFMFWDNLHPTTQTHAFIGAAMAAAVPEPGTWALMLIGFALAAWRVRCHRC